MYALCQSDVFWARRTVTQRKMDIYIMYGPLAS